MKNFAAVATSLILIGCSGSGAGGDSKGELAAAACDTYAKGQLAEKTYKLDRAALATSMADAGDGSTFLQGPIIIEPGLASESKQTLECTVRFVAGKDQPDVLKMQFLWE